MSQILIFAIDGLQPSQVTDDLMPNLAAFASGGVFFENHHPVYPSVTRVNAASIMTGCYPGRHGMVGNTLVIPEYDQTLAFSALEPELTSVVETIGRLLLRPTLADILSAHGMKFASVGAGSSGNAFIHNPRPGAPNAQTIHPQFTLPDSLSSSITERFGVWPERTQPAHERNQYGARVLTEYVLDDHDLAVYWCNEPDLTQHATGVNSPQGREALAIADDTFGKAVHWLQTNRRLDETDVMVVSDHGYSTSRGVIDIPSLIMNSPIDTPSQIIPGLNAGSVLFWVHPKSAATTDQLAQWLMAQPWCGAVTASDPCAGIEGALPARIVGLDGERAPDLTMSFTWTSDANEAGVPGLAYTAGMAPGLGDHGSLSAHEMRNTLIARGPSFKSGVRVDTPTGNVDLAPTALKILGLPGGESMDGRILEEAFAGGPPPNSVAWTQDDHRASRQTANGLYHQTITVSRVGKTTYIDQGIGERLATTTKFDSSALRGGRYE